jgi:2-hydroxychromene-2-carboxylate isomerase
VSAKSKAVAAVLNAYLSSRPAKHAAFNAGRILSGGVRRARLYYRADDPYSHLLVQVAPRLVDEFGFRIDVVPIAKPGLNANPAPEMLMQYALRDAAILAEVHGLDFPKSAAPPPEDRVRRAHSVLLQPRDPTTQLQVAIDVGDALWREDGEALGSLVERHGGLSGESVRPALEANYAALERAGHYQPGMLHYGGDWYWGVDRLGHLEQRLRREGAKGSLGLRHDRSPTLASMLELSSDAPRLELFVSFRSPYSYVSIPPFKQLRDRYGIEIDVRPVLPMVMRGLAVPRGKRLYIAFDAKREADQLGVPFGRVCDPLGKGIGYCMSVFRHCAEPRGIGLDFFHEVTKGAWSEGRDMAHLPDLVELCGRAGISASDVRAAIDAGGWKDWAQENRDDLTAMGLWGVPSFKIGDYHAWGQDRIPMLEAEIAAANAANGA